MRSCLFIAAMLVAAISSPHRADAQVPPASDDPLRHGHALLIGNSHYRDRAWAQLDDVPLQLEALREGLLGHFDDVQVEQDLDIEQLRQKIYGFLRTYGNDRNARLFIYYAGHGYTEVIRQRNENRGYITGIDTPRIDGTAKAYDAARLKAISMPEMRAPLEDVLAKSILFVFDSCFAGTIFTDRTGSDPPRPLVPGIVARLMEKPARDVITAGTSDQRVPAHSPIPELFLAALNGAADRYQNGVVSAVEIHTYLLNELLRMPNIDLTPQQGRLPNPAFAQGVFFFRVPNPTMRAPDESESIRLYRAAAAKGDAHAQVNLGYLYSQGLGGLPKDEREAARLYKLAADQGNAVAQTNLGLFYRKGRGGLPKDEREAVRLYKLAADQGNASGQTSLGVSYRYGRGGLPKDDREAVRLYKLAADQGSATAQTNLGILYSNGLGGLPKDEREAARLYKLAADQGNAVAQTHLGDFYREGRGGLPKDDREAVRLYKLAADQGNASGQTSLGVSYRYGRGGLPKDEREAARLYKLAADQGNAVAQTHLGDFYREGRGGLPKDEREAARLYKLAADQGDAFAQSNLGVFYEQGRGGLPKDEREAVRLYKLAAAQGDAFAKASLTRLAR
jgi:TPR repeat protein